MTQRSAQREKSWYIGGGTRESHTFGVYFLCFEFRSENGRGFEAQPFLQNQTEDLDFVQPQRKGHSYWFSRFSE